MIEYREASTETLWNMPHEVFWDKTTGATVRRGQWVIDNCPEVSLQELKETMALQVDDILQMIPTDEALCEDCPLNGKEKAREARRWTFEPAKVIDPKAPPAQFDKNTALACLSRYKREICNEPLPWSVTKELRYE